VWVCFLFWQAQQAASVATRRVRTDDMSRLERCCANCGAEPAASETFKRCGKCRITSYCSAACQKEAWKSHKINCGAALPSVDAVSSAPVHSAAFSIDGSAPGWSRDVTSVLREFGRADASLALAAMRRITALVEQAEGGTAPGSSRLVLRESGAAAAVVAGMKAHAADAELQAAGCAALAACGLGGKAWKLAVVAAGGLEAAVCALRGHAAIADVVVAAAAALRGCAIMEPVARHAVVAAGGAAAVVAAVAAHPVDEAVAREACAALGNMAGGDEELQKCVLACGGLEAIVAAMRRHAAADSVQAQGCGALGNLAAGDAATQRAVLEAGGAAAVVAAIRTHSEAKNVQDGGRAALTNMSWGDARLRSWVLEAGAEEAWLG
jgi:hypothetical protein